MLFFAMTLALMVVRTPAPPPAPAPAAFDEVAAKARYEAFLFRWFEQRWGPEKPREQLSATAKEARVMASPAVEPFPVDATRGVYANSPGKLGASKWLAVGLTTWPAEGDPDKILGALSSLSYQFENSFNTDTEPSQCLPGACFFAIHAEYQQPGFWVALRDIPGAGGATRTVFAGVLQLKSVPDDPAKDRGLKPWLAAVDAKFAPPKPEP